MTVTDAHRMAMPELAEARTRLDAQTVAAERRTPAVPITRFSYDRDAMQEARSARTRMAAPPAATPAPAATFAPPATGPAAAAAVAEDAKDRPAPAPRSVRPVRPVPVARSGRPARPSAVAAATVVPLAPETPIYVVACVAVYPDAAPVAPVPITRSAARPPAPIADVRRSTPRSASRPSILSAPAPVRAVPEPTATPVALDPVAARVEAAEADARLRAVALARRAASLQERLASEISVAPGGAGAAPAGRPGLLRRAVGA